MKSTPEEFEDFNRIKSTLGFKLFLSVIAEQARLQDEKILQETSSFDGLIPQQQAIGAKRALSYLLESHIELVKQTQNR